MAASRAAHQPSLFNSCTSRSARPRAADRIGTIPDHGRQADLIEDPASRRREPDGSGPAGIYRKRLRASSKRCEATSHPNNCPMRPVRPALARMVIGTAAATTTAIYQIHGLGDNIKTLPQRVRPSPCGRPSHLRTLDSRWSRRHSGWPKSSPHRVDSIVRMVLEREPRGTRSRVRAWNFIAAIEGSVQSGERYRLTRYSEKAVSSDSLRFK